MGGKRGFKNINLVSKLVRCLDHYGGGGSTLIILLKDQKEKRKKSNVRVRESVGSPISERHGPIEVNMHGRTFLLL